MNIKITDNPVELGKVSAAAAVEGIINAIKEKGQANVILATGASQFETLKNLVEDTTIDWSKVVMFHLDEYIGLPETAPASFRKYLKERFLNLVSPLKASYLVNGETDPEEECERSDHYRSPN